jgi:hypothetical protein
MLDSFALRSRRASVLACVVFAGLLLPQRVRAQSCHAASLRPTSNATDLTYRVSLSGVLGNFSTATTVGEYQGIFAGASLSHPWFSVEAALPVYRIAQTGSHAYGFGDLAVSARGHVYRSQDGEFVAGPELAATLPTGDAGAGLGMGHVMLMPGGFLVWQASQVSLVAQLAYGRALVGSSPAHHHMGPEPIVNPMNKSELAHAIGASVALRPSLRVTGRLFGAVSLFDHGGAAREVLAPGLQLIMGAFDASLEVQVPIVGQPFTSRTVISLGAQW